MGFSAPWGPAELATQCPLLCPSAPSRQRGDGERGGACRRSPPRPEDAKRGRAAGGGGARPLRGPGGPGGSILPGGHRPARRRTQLLLHRPLLRSPLLGGVRCIWGGFLEPPRGGSCSLEVRSGLWFGLNTWVFLQKESTGGKPAARSPRGWPSGMDQGLVALVCHRPRGGHVWGAPQPHRHPLIHPPRAPPVVFLVATAKAGQGWEADRWNRTSVEQRRRNLSSARTAASKSPLPAPCLPRGPDSVPVK